MRSLPHSALPVPRLDGVGSQTARVLTALVAVLWLLATAPAGHAVDALAYAAALREGGPLLHPHHLLYQPSVLVVARALALLGVAQPELAGARLHNLAWAGVAVHAMALLVTRATGRPEIGLWGALLLAASAGVGVFATQNDAYVPALACALVLLVVLQKADRRAGSLVLAAAAWALATLYHQTAVLLAFPVLWLLLRDAGGRQGLRAFCIIAGAAGGVTLALYGLAFHLEGEGASLAAFARYLLDYAYADVPLWRDPANFSAIGLLQVLDSQTQAILNVGLSPARLLAVLVCTVAVAGGAALLLAARDRLGIASVIGLAAFLLFNLWWLPVEPELAILPGALCVLIMSLTLARLVRGSSRPHRVLGVAWIALCGLAGVNALWSGEFRSIIRPEKLAVAQGLAALNRDNCLVLDEYVVSGALTYLAGQTAADVRRVLLSLSQDRAPPARLHEAACLLMRAQWLDPGKSDLHYLGAQYDAAWRRAVVVLFAQRATPGAVAAWRVDSQDDPQLGRVLRVRRADPVDMPPDQFWRSVTAALRGP